jgi:L-rhamnose mutarotase
MRYQRFISVLLLVVLAWAGLNSCGSGTGKKAQNADTLKVKAVAVKQPVIIEVIAAKGKELDRHRLYEFGKGWLEHGNIVHWKNHMAVYAELSDPEKLIKGIIKDYPNDSIKVYDKPFYNFNRKLCGDTSTAKVWTNIILTANLVADEKLQQEYLDYHKTQFEKWPEVSKGFCNANFQQLLVFKNGRQLMLVISIPKGESLDKLNPLTTKDNPRVDNWNKLMAKYQEGIPGTKPGEVWVFLKPHIIN